METIKFSPIGKQDIRIGDGQFEVTLADGSVVTLDELDLGYLTGDAVTEANLPSPVGSGKLARVTDGARNLWLDGPASKWFQVAGEVVNAENFASFSAAITDIGSTVRTLLIPRSLSVTGAVTVPANVTLWFVNQGALNISGGVTVIMNGRLVSAPRQIFTGSGLITIGSGRIEPVRIEWWGAVVDGSTDDTSIVQTAVTACNTTPFGIVFVPPGTVWTPGSVTIPAGPIVWDYADADAPVWRTSAISKVMLTAATTSSQFIQSLSILASVSANVLTVALKDSSGNDASASNTITIPFRSTTAGTSTFTDRTVSAALSVVLSSGSTVGFTASMAGRIYVVAIDNSGTVELALYNSYNPTGPTLLGLDEGLTYSTTAEGGAGGADSAQTLYSTTARTGVPIRILGYIDITTGATAGQWGTAPSRVQVMGPGVHKTGDLIQTQLTITGAVATGTTAIPNDDTPPTSSEGDQYMSQAITPTSVANLLVIEALGNWAHSASNILNTVLLQDSTVNSLRANRMYASVASTSFAVPLTHIMQAGTTSATTFKIRGGSTTGATTTFNGSAGTRFYGGVAGSFLRITEIFT